MPSLAVPQELLTKKSLPHQIVWSQDATNLVFTVKMNGIAFNPGRLHVQLEHRNIEISYLDITYDETRQEIYQLFQIPSLDLFSDIIPTSTQLKFLPQGFQMNLKKVKNIEKGGNLHSSPFG